MAYPVGIQTVTLRLGSSFDSAGTLAKISGSVTPLFGAGADHLVWDATGQTYAKVATALAWDDTEKVALAVVPHPVQAGWRDQTQAAFSGWSYKITAEAVYAGGQRQSFERVYTPQAGDTVVDIDLMPNGVAATPTVVAEWAQARSDALAALAASEVEQVTLTGDLTYTLPASVAPNLLHSVVFTQDATGGHTVTYNGTPVAVDPLPGAVTTIEIWPSAGVTLPGPLAGEISSALDTALAYANSASESATAASGYAVEAEGYKDEVALLAADIGAKVLTGSGKPVGVVTPSAVGQLYVDTTATAGARLWISTGLTAGYWVVAVGDTGWRDVTSAWAPMFTDAGGVVTFNAYPAIKARRVGALVEVYVQGLVKSLAGNATMQAGLPTGWRAVQSFDHLSSDSSLSIIRWVVTAGSAPASCNGPVGGARTFRLSWTTSDEWPSVLP